jgi:uroporphyrinogen-III synthase
MRVLVTRPQRQAERSAARLRAFGHQPVIAPVLAVTPTGEPPPAGPFGGLIVTSENAAPLLSGLGDAERAGPIFAVGARTAARLRSEGCRDVRSADGDALALAALIRTTLAAGSRLLHVAGRDGKPEPRAALLAAGFTVETWIAYEAAARPSPELLQALAGNDLDAALHYSRRSAAVMLDFARDAGLVPRLLTLCHVCLSQDVAEPLREAGARRLAIAREPTEEALIAALSIFE